VDPTRQRKNRGWRNRAAPRHSRGHRAPRLLRRRWAMANRSLLALRFADTMLRHPDACSAPTGQRSAPQPRSRQEQCLRGARGRRGGLGCDGDAQPDAASASTRRRSSTGRRIQRELRRRGARRRRCSRWRRWRALPTPPALPRGGGGAGAMNVTCTRSSTCSWSASKMWRRGCPCPTLPALPRGGACRRGRRPWTRCFALPDAASVPTSRRVAPRRRPRRPRRARCARRLRGSPSTRRWTSPTPPALPRGGGRRRNDGRRPRRDQRLRGARGRRGGRGHNDATQSTFLLGLVAAGGAGDNACTERRPFRQESRPRTRSRRTRQLSPRVL
jgi:hypothetical protein